MNKLTNKRTKERMNKRMSSLSRGMNEEPYSSSLDAFELAGVEGVLSQTSPLLQQRNSPRGQRGPHLTHLHQNTYTLVSVTSAQRP